MSRRLVSILICVLLPVAVLTAISAAAAPGSQISQLKQQLRNANGQISDLQDQVAAQDSALDDQSDTITRLRYRLANQPDPLDVITARNPDGLWQAMTAIWRAMPALDPGAICGYDKSNTPADDGGGLTLTSYTFYRWTGC